jgi:hypothetical protein
MARTERPRVQAASRLVPTVHLRGPLRLFGKEGDGVDEEGEDGADVGRLAALDLRGEVAEGLGGLREHAADVEGVQGMGEREDGEGLAHQGRGDHLELLLGVRGQDEGHDFVRI